VSTGNSVNTVFFHPALVASLYVASCFNSPKNEEPGGEGGDDDDLRVAGSLATRGSSRGMT